VINKPNEDVSSDQPVAVQPNPWADQQTKAKPKKFANLSDMGSGVPKKVQHDHQPQAKEEDIQKQYEGYSELSGKIIRELLNNNYECMVCCEGKKPIKTIFSIFCGFRKNSGSDTNAPFYQL
jgi:hypothetical protein